MCVFSEFSSIEKASSKRVYQVTSKRSKWLSSRNDEISVQTGTTATEWISGMKSILSKKHAKATTKSKMKLRKDLNIIGSQR